MDLLHLPWIVYVGVASLIGTLVGFIDNYVTDVLFDGKHPQAEKTIAGPLYTLIGVAILVIFRPSFETVGQILILAGAGMLSSFASVFYYAGMAREETTTAKIFSQLIPLFSLVLGWIFLGQQVDMRQIVAFGVMLLAPIIVVASKDRRSKKAGMKAAVSFIIYGLIYSVAALLFVQGSQDCDCHFLVAMALFLIGKGCMDMLIMGSRKKWRRHFYNEVKKHRVKIFAVIIANTLIWTFADILYRFAMVEADAVALANVSYEAIELIATFFFGIVLSLLWPSFGREKLNKRAILAHLVATAIAVLGIVLIG